MIDRVEQINGKEVSISQDLSLSHAGTVWDGAIVMSYFFNKNQVVANQFFQGKKVLELGSGTGMVGIAASMFGAKKVFLTDLPEYLKILEINRIKNLNTTVSVDCLEVRKLEWGNKQDIEAIGEIDTLIGSQLAYDKQNVILLMQTIRWFRQRYPGLKVMIAYQKYKQEWKNMQIKFSEYFGKEGYSLVGWDDFDGEYRDQNIGILYMT